MSYLGDIEAGAMRLVAHCQHVKQGETGTLTLLRHRESDGTLTGFTPAIVIASGSWTKSPIRPDFDARNDGDVIFEEELQLSEDAITAANADLVMGVQIGLQIYKARLDVGPRGLSRYWKFSILPLEVVDDSLTVLTESLIAFWKLDEASGSRLDSSGNGFSLTPGANGTLPANGAGKVGNGIVFVNAERQYLERTVTGSDLALAGSFTVAGWLKVPTGGNRGNVLLLHDGAGAYLNLLMYLSGSTVLLGLEISSSQYVYVDYPASLALNAWYFFTLSVDRVADMAALRVNQGDIASASTFALPASFTRLTIGGSTAPTAPPSLALALGATLDAFGAWDVVLDAAQMTALYNSAVGREPPFV